MQRAEEALDGIFITDSAAIFNTRSGAAFLLELEAVRRNRKRGDENYEFMDNGIEGNKLEVGFLDFCVAVNQQQLC